MTRSFSSFATLAACGLSLLLAGCGGAPTMVGHGLTHAPGAVRVRDDARRVSLHVPQALVKEVEKAVAHMNDEVGSEWVTDMYGRKMYPRYRVEMGRTGDRDFLEVVASRDGFKTTVKETTMYDGRSTGNGIDVPYFTTPGAVTYYLAVHAEKVEAATGKRTRLDTHYVSNLGRNYEGELK